MNGQDNDVDPQDQDQTQSQVPTFPEGYPQSEVIQPEVEKTSEVVQKADSSDDAEPESVEEPKQEPAEKVSHVVDKRTYHEELESVDKTSHKLTKEADEEEEEFIEHVEEVHSE